MTTNQRITLMADWWPRACAAQGWNKNDRAKRIQVLSDIVGRDLKSASDLNTSDDLDKVKSALLAFAEPANLDSQVAIANMPRKRLEFAIHKLDATFGQPSGEDLSPYGMAILRNRFGTTRLDNLDDKQLLQLRNTLAARKSAKRRSAPVAADPAPVESEDPF